MLKRLVLVAALVAAVVLPLAAPAAALTPVPVANAAPYGVWVLPSGYELRINVNGTYSLSGGGFPFPTLLESGTWIATPALRQLRFVPGVPAWCSSSGKYQWRASSGYLRFQSLGDSCTQRRAVIGGIFSLWRFAGYVVV